MSDADPLAAARAMVKAGVSDAEIQAQTGVTALQLLELHAEHAAGGTTLRWIIPNVRAQAERRRGGLLKWFGRR
jgi:hypothetical protein